MAHRLKSTDISEQWFSRKEARNARQKKTSTTVSGGKEYCAEKVLHERGKRGQRQQVAQSKGVREEKEKINSIVALNDCLALAKMAVPDVEELSQKRMEDAVACGRIVKSICAPRKERSNRTTRTTNSIEGNCTNNKGRTMPCPHDPSSPAGKQNTTWSDATKVVEQDAKDCGEIMGDNHTLFCSDRPWKKPIDLHGHRPADQRRRLKSTVHRKSLPSNADSDSDLANNHGNTVLLNKRRGSSPIRMCSTDRYRGRDLQRRDSQEQARQSKDRQSKGTQYPEAYSSSLDREMRSHSPVLDSDSAGQSTWRSLLYGRGKEHHQSGQRIKQNYEGRRVGDRFEQEEKYRNSGRYCTKKYYRHWQDESSSEQYYGLRQDRPGSAERVQGGERNSIALSGRSQPRMSPSGTRGGENEWRHSIGRTRGISEQPASVVRRQRRYRQASKESEKAKQERAGKKPFYLTVDSEGKPYGAGKPAWIAEINKLAIGLDPSCTHVRKQTFEDVQKFKDRLNESFEYSGTLNEDYLRGLMGKAVTKKRSQLIALIKNDGEQPLYIDREVWHRLQKLADSKQWEEKSEQCRYANACRMSIGRTGPIGENGVTENLRLRLGRSPDPDEVEEEMQRDKGFGGRKRKKPAFAIKEKKFVEVVNSDKEKDMDLTDDGEFRSPLSSPGEGTEMLKVQKSGKSGKNGVHEGDIGTGENGHLEKRHAMLETTTLSKDDYIQQLEAQILWLQEQNENALTSNVPTPSESCRHVIETAHEI